MRKLKVNWEADPQHDLHSLVELSRIPRCKWLYDRIYKFLWNRQQKITPNIVCSCQVPAIWRLNRWWPTRIDPEDALMKTMANEITKEIDNMILEELIKQLPDVTITKSELTKDT